MSTAVVVERPPVPRKLWGPLTAPVDPRETLIRMRAQSYLTGSLIDGQCPPLTLGQAKDVLAWAGITV